MSKCSVLRLIDGGRLAKLPHAMHAGRPESMSDLPRDEPRESPRRHGENDMNKPTVHRLSFPGAILARGFWLYIWRIVTDEGQEYLHAGRTGDSSSRNRSHLLLESASIWVPTSTRILCDGTWRTMGSSQSRAASSICSPMVQSFRRRPPIKRTSHDVIALPA